MVGTQKTFVVPKVTPFGTLAKIVDRCNIRCIVGFSGRGGKFKPSRKQLSVIIGKFIRRKVEYDRYRITALLIIGVVIAERYRLRWIDGIDIGRVTRC